jgi:hypothetical protein
MLLYYILIEKKQEINIDKKYKYKPNIFVALISKWRYIFIDEKMCRSIASAPPRQETPLGPDSAGAGTY